MKIFNYNFKRRLLHKQILSALVIAPSMLMSSHLALADNLPTTDVNKTNLAVTDDTVKVGILHSLTGTMSISETGSVEAEKLAIEQINAQGGVLGRQIEYIQEDGASDWPTFAEKSKKLLIEDKVATVATQQIISGIDWVSKDKGAKKFFLLGSDYIWPRTSNKIARKHIEKLGGKVVGEEYYPLGHTQFNSVINKIKLKKPDVIYAIVVGGSNVSFYKQLKAAGIDMAKEKPLVLTISVTEDEILGIGGENMEGAYAAMKYFQSLPNENNKAFVSAFKKKWGEDSVIGDVTQAAYLGPWLWKAAVEKAGSFDVDKVRAASPGLELKTAPEGYVRIHENHHLWSKTRIARAGDDGQYELVYETDELIEPNPFPKGYQ